MSNKYQKAYNTLREWLEVSENEELYNAKQTIKELINKQTPRKPKSEPIGIGDSGRLSGIAGYEFYCPNCNEEIYFNEDYEPEYCDACGQRLNWEEDIYEEEN